MAPHIKRREAILQLPVSSSPKGESQGNRQDAQTSLEHVTATSALKLRVRLPEA
jgi:hypothetical protein